MRRISMGVLIGLLGAVAGAATGIAVVYALLAGEDALIWVPTMMVFAFLGMPMGAAAALLLCRPQLGHPLGVGLTRFR